jgi:hypothetical protein
MRKPLPIKVSVLGSASGVGPLSSDEAIARTQELVARANKRAFEEMESAVLLPPPPRRRMNDGDKIRYLLEHGHWPSPARQRGY